MAKPEINGPQKPSFFDGVRNFLGRGGRNNIPMVEIDEGRMSSEEDLIAREGRFVGGFDYLFTSRGASYDRKNYPFFYSESLLKSIAERDGEGKELESMEIALIWGWFHSIDRLQNENIRNASAKIRLRRLLLDDANKVEDLYKPQAAATLVHSIDTIAEDSPEWEARWNYIEKFGTETAAAEVIRLFYKTDKDLVSHKLGDRSWNFLQKQMTKQVALMAIKLNYYENKWEFLSDGTFDEEAITNRKLDWMAIWSWSNIKPEFVGTLPIRGERTGSYLYQNRLKLNRLIIPVLAGGENQRERLTFEFGFTDRNYVPKEDAWDWVDQMSLRDKDSAYKFLAEIVRKQAIGEQVSDLTESFKLLRGEDIELAMHYNLAIGWLVKYLPRVEKEQLWQMMEDNGGLRVLELLENSVGSCRDEAEQKRILDMIQKIKERGRSATFNSE